MVAYLQKPEGSEAFHQIIDFLNASHIKYALIENPKIYISIIQQFWGTATARTTDDEEVEITASIDGQIFEQLALMVYVSDSARLTFQKGHFSPQWRTFNFSKMIFDAMVKNLDNTHKFLMYPIFLQICLNKQKRLLQPHTRTYPTPTLTQKPFSNMKRVSKGYSGVDFPLFPTMITTPESSPSKITSSPSLSPQTYQSPLKDITRQDAEIPQSQFPTQTQIADESAFTSIDVDAGGAATTDIGLELRRSVYLGLHKTPTRPYDSPLPRVHTLTSDEGSLQQNELMDLVTKLTDRVEVLKNDMQQTKKVYKSALTKLILRVKKLEKTIKTNKARRRARIYCEGFTTASVPVITASATLEVSTTTTNLVYIKKSAEKRKDKGKAIMKEDESVQKKTKKQLEQERLGHKEAIRLQEQINEEKRQRITGDAEIAKQLQEEFDRERQEQEVVDEADQSHDIDWSDPVVLRYHALQNRSFSIAKVRKNMCMYLKTIQEETSNSCSSYYCQYYFTTTGSRLILLLKIEEYKLSRLKQSVDAGQSEENNVSTQQYIVFPLWSSISSSYKSSDENDTTNDSAGEPLVQKPASENE
ncbi:hypothetical protein Tco_0301063 [Tanacetum coccineum]